MVFFVSSTIQEGTKIVAAKRFKKRDLSPVSLAALNLAFPNCPFCGHSNSVESFTLVSKKGSTFFVSGEDSRIDCCHIDTRISDAGSNRADNLFLGHHICNQRQAHVPLQFHLDDIDGKLTEEQIRTISRQAYARAQRFLNGESFDIELARETAKVLRQYPNARIGNKLREQCIAA